MDEGMYKTMYPNQLHSPKFFGLPKIHKTGTPLRLILSSQVSVTYRVAKILTKVLKPLVGKPSHHIQSTRDFVNRVKVVTLLLGECLCSYDVSTLFTSVPIGGADTGNTWSNLCACIHQTGHNSTPDNFSILGREDQGLTWTIKEAIYIRINNPTLHRNIGKFNLNHI